MQYYHNVTQDYVRCHKTTSHYRSSNTITTTARSFCELWRGSCSNHGRLTSSGGEPNSRPLYTPDTLNSLGPSARSLRSFSKGGIALGLLLSVAAASPVLAEEEAAKPKDFLGLDCPLTFGGFTTTSAQEPTDEEILAKDGALLEQFFSSQRCLYFPRVWCCLYLTRRGVSPADCMLRTGQGCDIRVDCKTKEEQFRWAKAYYRTV